MPPTVNGTLEAKEDPSKFKAKKSKAASKKTALTYQYQIMETIHIPRNEIKKFAEAEYWLEYFPPLAIEDCNAMGLRIDWRRSFLTTDINPYYDSFVRWQMNKLYQLQKIKFGERYTIYSPKDGQPCMDHDRQTGEALGPQEYTAIKLEILEIAEAARPIFDSHADKLNGRKVHMIAATLRPETMYGQTCTFVSPNIDYGVFAINDKEAYLCTKRSMRNMAFQKITDERGSVNLVFTISGKALIGTLVNAPLSVHPNIRVLPMDTVSASKGTAVVCCVPSDSPDDFATQLDLQKKAAYYNIKPEWVALDPVPIIRTPTYGDLAAEAVVKKLKIQSPKDAKLLAEAKEIVYKEGYYQGIMLVGDYKGEKVEVAKSKVRDDLVAEGLAFVYDEPEGLVVSRSGEECVVALCDQWYLDYGETSWRAAAEELLAGMNTYQQETRNAFEGSLDWLNQWACARSYGLGSKLPWDPQYLVESLSDSTIYMSYYTIAHHLHSDLKGAVMGAANITADQLTDEVWDYILVRGSEPKSSIDLSTLQKLRREYEYWYPLDVRVSGKDLIPNHLTFFIYVHSALFPKDEWPRGVRCNGHLQLNKEKMSKSTGNFLTLRQSVELFGADATRIALADAGDDMNDANFDEETANALILRIHTLKDWCVVRYPSDTEDQFLI